MDSRTPIINIAFLPSVSQAAEIAMLIDGLFFLMGEKVFFSGQILKA